MSTLGKWKGYAEEIGEQLHNGETRHNEREEDHDGHHEMDEKHDSWTDELHEKLHQLESEIEELHESGEHEHARQMEGMLKKSAKVAS